jgi:Flp pilus assembly protein TadB
MSEEIHLKDLGFESREYKIYKEEERLATLQRTLYEKACSLAARILKIKPDTRSGKKLKEAIDFSHIRITPGGVASLTVLSVLIICIPTILLLVLKLLGMPGLSLGYALLILFLVIPFTFYIYTYPMHLKKKYEMEAGSEIVTMILYMAIYMRNYPNLERAVRFASENITGPLAFELRKLMWDLEVGNYITIEEALMDYTKKWSMNREFVEAIEIILESRRQKGERRIAMLDEAIDIILEGNREGAKHFNQNLRTPVMVVHAMGIILPVLGLVLFPIVAVFLGVQAIFLFIGYDVLLPIFLFFIITNILEKRPSTFSRVDISENPDIPPAGKFNLGKNNYKAWPFALVFFFIMTSVGYILFVLEGEEGLLSPVVITGGIAGGFAIYYILLTKDRLDIREKTREIEKEFAEAIYQLGNQISTGIPIELSVERAIRRTSSLKTRDLFQRTLNNMKTLGMTFSDALFDKIYGAIRFYPSKMIKTVMRIVAESSIKGVMTASAAMLSVSKYLKDIHKTQEEVRDELSDTLSSMRFQAFLLSPLICGVVVTLAIIIIKIMGELSQTIAGTSITLPFLNMTGVITPFQFVFVVAIYLVETSFILSMFINGIENGEDPIGRQSMTASSLIFGFIVFVITLIVTMLIFGPLITAVIPR